MSTSTSDDPWKAIAERVLAKAHERGVSVGSAVPPVAILQFEQKLAIKLPADYKAFLRYIGNGSQGPYDSTLYYFQDPLREIQPRTDPLTFKLDRIMRPFPFSEGCLWDDDPTSPGVTIEEAYAGNVGVADGGCGSEWRLIVAGSERGNIWYFADGGMYPTEPRRNFLAWYEAWLDGERWRPDFD